MGFSVLTSSTAICNFVAQIIPVTFKAGDYAITPANNYFTNRDGSRRVSFGQQPPEGCSWVEIGNCAKRVQFSKDSYFALTLQMDNRLTGWLFGQMKNSKVSVQPLPATTNRVRVEGGTVYVASGCAEFPFTDLVKYPEVEQVFNSRCWDIDITTRNCVTMVDQGIINSFNPSFPIARLTG
jgi:hypothetical protein